MKRNFSLSSRITAYFTPLHIGFGLCLLIYFSGSGYSLSVEHDRQLAILIQAISKKSLEPSSITEVGIALNEAVTDGLIDFYVLRHNDEPIMHANAAGLEDNLYVVAETGTESYEFPGYEVHTVRNGEYHLDVGFKRSRMAYTIGYLKSQLLPVLFQIIAVAIIVFGVSRSNLRSLLTIAKRFLTKGADRGDANLGDSKETAIIVHGIHGYERKIKSLSEEHQILQNQVLPSLRKEISSGKEPPYSFMCTLVRTDINDFSTIVDQHGLDDFMVVINEFFEGVSHIVSRYSGLIHEFIGDEVLYYFKDDDCGNSAAMAISAVRDVNKLAEQFNERTLKHRGYPFRVKSSLSYGSVLFRRLVHGYGIGGIPLIESHRILMHVQDKHLNPVLYPQAVHEKIADLNVGIFSQTVSLKGIAEPRKLYNYSSHPSATELLDARTKESFDLLSFYRSNDDIAHILRFVASPTGCPNVLLLQLLQQLKTYMLTQDSAELQDLYLALINALIGRGADPKYDHYLLSSALMLASNLFSIEAFKTKARPVFIKCLQSSDRRVVANAIESFSVLEPEAVDNVFASFTTESDNRIVANALVKEGKRRWEKKLAKKIQKMLASKDPLYVSSALFALGEIAFSLKEEDQATYYAHADLQKLIGQLTKYAVDKNQMTRRQAMRAIVKSTGTQSLLQLRDSAEFPPFIRAEVDAIISGKIGSESARKSPIAA